MAIKKDAPKDAPPEVLESGEPIQNEAGETGIIEQNEANLAFVFRGKKDPETGERKLDLTRAVRRITHGMERIRLPEPEDQAVPFYHEDAELIASLFPFLYKVHKEKG